MRTQVLRSLRRGSGAALLLAIALIGPGCGDAGAPTAAPDSVAPALDGPFVPIYRETPHEVLESRQAALNDAGGVRMAPVTQDFYIALSKKELGQKWFLSAYLTQAAPYGVEGGAATSMGTRVVSFKIQNGKLFMFDVADDKVWSDTFRPDVVLEAYPIVEGYAPFERQRGSSDYVLFDPAAGLNRFRLLQDTWGPIELDLSFSQRFRKIADGATFEQVVSGTLRGYVISPYGDAAVGVPNFTGTLSLGLRRYKESEDYRPTQLPPADHYFTSPPRLTPNQSAWEAVAAKWSVKPGKPIVWKIARLAATLSQSPEYAGIDLVGAIKRGIESWNVAFGYRAIEARLAEVGESFGDDDVNYFILDSHQTFGAAFANWRDNPNTGEIRGASVYFPVSFFQGFPPESSEPLGDGSVVAVEGAAGKTDKAARKRRKLGWGIAEEETLCERVVPSLAEVAETTVASLPELSRKEKIERLLAHIAAHEIGHTLGLRHNFKGSLVPPSTSVMDYLVDADSMVMNDSIGSYDVAAIRYLYDLDANLPRDPFCTDELVESGDPDCRMFDVGRNPLTDDFIPKYAAALGPFLHGESNRFLPPHKLVAHVRLAGDGAVRLQAYEAAFGPLRAPTPPTTPLPSFAGRVDFATRFALQYLFRELLPFEDYFPLREPPLPRPPAAPVLEAAVADLATVLVDQAHLRSAATRRLTVDILKSFQSPKAYAALAEARAQLSEQLPGLTGDVAVETMDLVSRIERALGAYFE